MQRYDLELPLPEIRYNRKFMVDDLASGIAGLLQLSEIPAGKSYRRAVGRTAVELLTHIGHVGNEEKNLIISEMDKEYANGFENIDQ